MTPGPVRDLVGYYVGDPSRLELARAVAAEVRGVLVGLAPWPRPAGWAGPWVELPGALDGELEPVAEMSSWLRSVEPSLVVVDGSCEIALLVRLHGVPVLALTSGRGRSDEAPLPVPGASPVVADDPTTVLDLVRRWTTPTDESSETTPRSLGQDAVR